MGYSSWDHKTYRATSASYENKTREQVFTSRHMHPDMDPATIVMRESRDSEQHPNSTPLIFGFDETGSMGDIPDQFVRKDLGRLMTGIFDTKPVSDPHIMVCGIGDANTGYEEAPLQCSQFETDIRIANQLTNIYLEGKGGGNNGESYELLWYFAAAKTSTDCYEKRGKKGYLFTIGDEPLFTRPAPSSYMNRVFAGHPEVARMSIREALAAAQEKYHVFHLIIEEGDYIKMGGLNQVVASWSILEGRALRLRKHQYIAEAILAIIRVNEGADPEEVIASIEGKGVQEVVRDTLYSSK